MMYIDKEEVMDFISKYGIYFLIGIIIVLQAITISKVGRIENTYSTTDRKIDDLQLILGVSKSSDTGKPMVQKGALNPTEKAKVLLPIKPDNDRDIAYIEKGYMGNENYYPTDTPITYYVSDSVAMVGASYSKKLINTGWQIQDLKKSTKPGTDYIESFSASNGISMFTAEFLETFPSYTKQIQGGSFVKITLKK